MADVVGATYGLAVPYAGGGGAEQDLPASVIAQEWNCAGGHAEPESMQR